MYCPPGIRTRTCNDGSWGAWSKCAAGTTWKTYYGDGGTHCGTVVCIQVSPTGSNDNLAITISKANSGTLDNDTDISLQPSGSTPQWYYCMPTPGEDELHDLRGSRGLRDQPGEHHFDQRLGLEPVQLLRWLPDRRRLHLAVQVANRHNDAGLIAGTPTRAVSTRA